MSGIGKTSQPDLGFLERLSQAPSGTIKVDESGKRFTMDTDMTFRSGTHRLFGQGKSEEDVQQNRATLSSILDYIGEKAGQSVLDKVLNSELRLGGDGKNSYTVGDRLERGTYVSNKLVAELLQITRTVIAGENDEIAEQERLVAEKLKPFQDQSRSRIDSHLSHDLSDSLDGMREGSGIKDDYTWQKFKEFVSDNKSRIKSSYDEAVDSGAKWDRSLSHHDITSGLSGFVSNTLLPEFLDAQPVRKSLDEMHDNDIAKAVRTRLESFDQGNVDSFVQDLLRKKEDQDDDDTRGMINLRQIRDSLAGQLKKEGRETISGEELVDRLDPRMLSDMLREHVIRR